MTQCAELTNDKGGGVGSSPGIVIEFASLSAIKIAGIVAMSGLTSPRPTNGTFSALHKNLVVPDARRVTTSIHPGFASFFTVTMEFPTTHDFSEIETILDPGSRTGFDTISPSGDVAGFGSALAYVYLDNQS